MMTASETDVIYPTVVVKVNGMKCRALLDTASGSNYASTALIKTAKLKKVGTKQKEIEMMFDKVVKEVGIHDAELTSTNGEFSLQINVSEVNKPELLSVKNPNLAKILKKYSHLQGVTTNDYATKDELPIHLVLGTGAYSNIRTATAPRVGEVNQPNAEYTKLGWVIMSPGKESDVSHVYTTSAHPICDFEQLCRLDVLGLQDETQSEDTVLQRFLSQLSRDESGRYETDLLWKATKKPLKSYERGSIARLRYTKKQLDRDVQLKEECDKIIEQQLSEGIIEKVAIESPSDSTGPICYMPCRPVVRKTATTSKTRLVFDASAAENRDCASLNESIEVGPPMQNLLWDIVIRNRFYPVAVLGDMKQAFLQIVIRERSRDALRFHWFDPETGEIVVYRFCRLPFGLGEAPFILGGTVKEHLNSEKSTGIAPVETLEKIDEEIFMDDLTSGEFTIEDAKTLKATAIETFKRAGFELHKWNSNVSELEDTKAPVDVDETFAKQQLGNPEHTDGKILGIHWRKEEDAIGVKISKPTTKAVFTKREILCFLASIFDPLGVLSSCMLIGKDMFREACELKLNPIPYGLRPTPIPYGGGQYCPPCLKSRKMVGWG